MEPMTLAEKVACDFQRDQLPVIKDLWDKNVAKHRKQVAQAEKERNAYHKAWFALRVLVQRLEPMCVLLEEENLADTPRGMRFKQSADEIRKLNRQVEKVLNG